MFLGFLNLHRKDCSGNQGIKDVILSLQWIKENISVFGGDPKNVTIMGSSSGASIVHCLLLSPLAKGIQKTLPLLMSCTSHWIGVQYYIINENDVTSPDCQLLQYQ